MWMNDFVKNLSNLNMFLKVIIERDLFKITFGLATIKINQYV